MSGVSLPQCPPVPCARCGQVFRPELYVIVDSQERPDLVQRIRDGILHCAVCPHCQVVMAFGMPLLVYRPGQPVPVMYSPVAGADASVRQAQFGVLMEALRERLGAAWDDRLARGVYFADRDDLPAVVDCNPHLLPGGPDPSLREAMDQYLHCATWEEAQAALERYPVLLGPEGEFVLRRGMRSAAAGDDVDAEATLTEHLDVLSGARSASVSEAFRTKLDGSGRTVKLNLEAIYRELARVPPDDLAQTAALLRAALQRVRREDNEQAWADLQSTLGDSLIRSCQQGDRRFAPEAAEHLRLALEFYGRGRDPNRWATLTRQLAEALEIAHGEPVGGPGPVTSGSAVGRADEVIARYEDSLSVLSRAVHPHEWAYVQFKLGVLHIGRPGRGRAEHIETGIGYLEAARSQFEEAEGRPGGPDTMAVIHLNLGAAYSERFLGDAKDNVEKALAHLPLALEAFEALGDTAHVVSVLGNLAGSYCARLAGERLENLERAIEYGQRGLDLCAREAWPDEWVRLHHVLGTAFQERIKGEGADNLERSVQHLETALSASDRLARRTRWSIHNNLGNSYHRRTVGDAAENVQRSLQHLLDALSECSREDYPEDWATTQVGLCNVYRMAARVPSHLEKSIEHGDRALEVYAQDSTPMQWATAHLALAGAWSECGDPDRMARHTATAQEVLRKDRYPQRWATAQANLGVGLGRAGRHADATRHLLAALTVFTAEQFPADYARTCRLLAEQYFAAGEYKRAYQTFEHSIVAGEQLLRSAYTEAGRRREVSATTNSYAMWAYCSLKLGRYQEAPTQLDRGKARLLAEVLAEEQWLRAVLADPEWQVVAGLRQTINELEAEQRLVPDTAARRSDREIADGLRQAREELAGLLARAGIDVLPQSLDLPALLATIPEGGFMLAPIVTPRGSAVLVMADGMTAVGEEHVVWLDSLTQANVAAFLFASATVPTEESWFGAYARRQEAPERWMSKVESVGSWLWENIMGPVDARLRGLGAREGVPVVVLPQGGIGVLPLGSAWRPHEGGRRYIVDDYTLYYAPGAYALRASAQRLGEPLRQGIAFCGIIDPTDDLPAAAAEGELVARNFPVDRRVSLTHELATRDAVLARAVDANYLHFSCHALFDPRAPFRSALRLAKGGQLTLADVASRLRLSSSSLVCLSACETGIIEPSEAPDEFLGFPATFHQAGAPAVTSTLWAVDDRVTMLLMDRFYRQQRETGCTPPVALREAQLWLKQASAAELARVLAEYKELSGCPAAKAVGHRMYVGMALTPVEDSRPYAHPYYWAAFTYSGAAGQRHPRVGW